MCNATKKLNHTLALVLSAALVIGFALLSSRSHPAPTRDHASSSLVAGKFHEDEREEIEREGEPGGAAWFMSQRTYGLGYIPQDAEIRAVEDMRNRMIPELAAKGIRLQKSAAGQLNWEFRGPGNIGGRLRGLVVHPNNPNILYAGSVSGGVWKSTNTGATWAPTMNDLITLNISALAMKPGDPNTLYAGTGEAFLSGDALPGRGLLKTTNGGQTWKRIHTANGLNSPFITALAVSPANPNVVYAAGRKAVPQIKYPAETVPDPGVSAIFKSTDSGETWQNITTGKGIEHDPQNEYDDFAADVVVSPTDANVVYATFGLYYWGGIWKSTNGGQTWSRLTNGLPDPNLPNMGYGRIKLAMAPSNPNVLYASFTYAHKNGDTIDLKDEGMLGLWKTTNGGLSWTQVKTPLTINQRNRNDGYATALSFGNYANTINVHPTNPDIVFVGGLDIYRSTDGGNTWSQVSMWIPPGDLDNPEGIPYVHADHHVFTFDRSTNPPTLYDGSDGGVSRSRDLGATWEILNKDLGVTQFYFLAAHPTDPNMLMGGSQDNGTPSVLDGDHNGWVDITGGDGGPALFDFNSPNTFYVSVYEVNMFRVTDGVNWKDIGFADGSNGITQEDVNGAAFFAPYEMSPNNPNVLVLGTNRLLKTTDRGDSWTSLMSNRLNVPIVSVAIAEGNDNIIWMASDDAQVYKTEDNGDTYTNVTGANLPNRFVTDIEFDPSSNRTVYLTYSGYGTPHVFKSTNAGASWTNITNNLPDAPANTIQVHPQNPNLLFLGTDIGVFLSENGGQTWQPSANGFPTAQVVAIVLNTNLNRIYAATHGRGVYSAQLTGGTGTAELSVDVPEVAIQVKPDGTATSAFKLSNIGTADLSFNLTASKPTSAALGFSAVLETRLTGATNSSSPHLPPLVLNETTGEKPKNSRAKAVQAQNLNVTSSAVAGDDVLFLDDGNDMTDSFFGLQGTGDTYWSNRFVPSGNGFQLERILVFASTESVSNPSFFVAVEADGQQLVKGNVTLPPAQDGTWYTINLPTPLSFGSGQAFFITLGAPKAIAFPAGVDQNASVPNNSFYFEPSQNKYVPLSTIRGFENGAFLIRAAGTKLGGGNQPPIAKAQISANSAAVNESITFDASRSFDPDGQITQYLWDFGDNTTSTQKVATHAYAQAGNYLAKLTVTDDKGATGQAIRLLTITSGDPNRLAVNPTSGTVAPGGAQTITVTFDARGLAAGNYQSQIDITSNGGNRTIPVHIRVSNTTVNELAYDNGTQTKYYYWPTAGQGSAVRFTPPSKPAKVSQAKIFITDFANGNQFNLRVLADANGVPGNTIYGPAPVTVANTGWATFDLSAANISVNGDFYIMIEYNGTSKPFLGSEDTPPIAKRSWDFDGQSWALFDTEDYLIRAVVEYTTSVAGHEGETSVPTKFELAQNYPNPFNPETTIKYQLPARAQVELAVYDLTGRRVAMLESSMKAAGEHLVRWDGRDNAGNRVASGIYFYRLEATSSAGIAMILTKKMTLMK